MYTLRHILRLPIYLFSFFCYFFKINYIRLCKHVFVCICDHKTYLHMYNVYPQQQAIAAVAARYLIYVHILRNGSTNKKRKETKENGRDEIIIHIFLKACYPFLYYLFCIIFLRFFSLLCWNSFFFLLFSIFFMLYTEKKLIQFSIYMFIFLSY